MTTVRVPIDDPSAIGAARRQATELARRAGLNETDTGRVGLVVTEAATNVVKHAGRGEMLLSVDTETASPAIDVLALDQGPGIADIGEALRDGVSRSGTPGNGLGAMGRLGSDFDIYSRPDGGTALFARIAAVPATASPHRLVVSGINVPHPAETVSGDCWSAARRPSATAILVADGLGHGIDAHRAAATAAQTFAAQSVPPDEQVLRIHQALRATRGAAVAVAEVDPEHQVMRFAGLGNISGTIIINGATRSVVSHHGTAGHDVRRIQEFTYPWSRKALLVLHSDGLMTRWSLAAYPGLVNKPPLLIAGVLYRDFRRGRDDTTVVVAREQP